MESGGTGIWFPWKSFQAKLHEFYQILSPPENRYGKEKPE
jgi:hypothetical protein